MTEDLNAPQWLKSSDGTGSPIPLLLGDPDLTIWDGQYWLYATNDGNEGWVTHTVNAFSSPDLVNWTNHGVAYDSVKSVAWPRRSKRTWAPAVLHRRDGKHVLYTAEDGNIACAVADDPAGPFEDIGHPLISAGSLDGYQIDASVFQDVDGTNYLLWGNGVAHMAPLSQDGTSVDLDRVHSWTPPNFVEAIDLRHRSGWYIASWSVGDTRKADYHLEHAVSRSPFGPWEHRGVLLEPDPNRSILSTGHHSVVNVPGTDDWILAYHRWAEPTGAGWRREVMFAPLSFAPDGSLLSLSPTDAWYCHPLPANSPLFERESNE